MRYWQKKTSLIAVLSGVAQSARSAGLLALDIALAYRLGRF
jgi:hypothetical protein